MTLPAMGINSFYYTFVLLKLLVNLWKIQLNFISRRKFFILTYKKFLTLLCRDYCRIETKLCSFKHLIKINFLYHLCLGLITSQKVLVIKKIRNTNFLFWLNQLYASLFTALFDHYNLFDHNYKKNRHRIILSY